MIWLVIEEPQYLKEIATLNNRIKELNLLLPELTKENTLLVPTEEAVNKNMILEVPKIVVDYREPKYVVDRAYNIFTIIDVKAPDFPFTSEHKQLNIDKATVLSEKLGLRIAKPAVTLDDMAGAEILHEDISKMLNLEKMGLMNITGLFLFGVAGAGKSYFAECFAGSTGRHFVMLDLAHFMSLPNPTKSIDDVFVFLLEQDEKYVLLIDEIEKMFQLDGSSTNLLSDQIFGKMLTWLAMIYEGKGNNLTFVATANRVENLLKNKPEFVRRGRFDRLYFLNYPKVDSSAPAIMTMYLDKERKNIQKAILAKYDAYQKGEKLESEKLYYIFNALTKENIEIDVFVSKIITNEQMNVERMIQVVEGLIGKDKITDAQYFIYTPPEIKSLVKEILQSYAEELTTRLYTQELQIHELYSDNIGVRPIQDILEEIVFMTPPLQITAPDGIGHQLAQAKNIKQGDRIAPFTEVS
jgi:SpoVK/Ycf46/Vps4 family AAA+-type ATPase